MDGNGRWAESQGLPRIEGHRAGIESVKVLVKACVQKKIPIVSLFAFSRENWARPADEVAFLMELFVRVLARELPELHAQNVRVQFIGDKTQLSAKLCADIQSAELHTAENKALLLNIALNYTGKWDILQATRTIAQRVMDGALAIAQIDDAVFASYLSTSQLPEPDLFIRTSGEQRISDFFLWQLAFTELYFTETKWPDFTLEEFERALTAFHLRERRYGLISKQLKASGEIN